MKELLDDVAVELLADELHVVVRDAVGLDVAATLHVAKLAQLVIHRIMPCLVNTGGVSFPRPSNTTRGL